MIGLALLCTLVVARPAAASFAPSTDASASSPRLQSLLNELVADGASGAIALVDDGRRTVRLSSGAARLGNPPVPLRPSARVRVGSITKTFVATVALQLVGEGRLRLDDTVAQWLPGLVPGGAHITVRQLLNHTSGIFNYTDTPRFNRVDLLLRNRFRDYTPRQLVALATSHQPLFPPGTGWSYSNTNYILAGLVIEAASGRTVGSLLQDRIFGPLHLTNTVFPGNNPYIPGYHAHGYAPPALTGDGYFDLTAWNESWAWAAGALISTADDLHRFYSALLGGRLLRPALLRQMETTVDVLPVTGYGLGLFFQRGPCGTAWGHDGGIPGYLSFAYNDRSGRRSAVVLLPTQPDQRLGSLLQLTIDTAVCQMFGRVPAAAPPGYRIGETQLTGLR